MLGMQSHLIELIGESAAPQGRVTRYSRILAKMMDFEEHKYLPPKFSELLAPLCRVLGIAGCAEQRIVTGTEERADAERIKVSTQSLNKYRARSNYRL